MWLFVALTILYDGTFPFTKSEIAFGVWASSVSLSAGIYFDGTFCMKGLQCISAISAVSVIVCPSTNKSVGIPFLL